MTYYVEHSLGCSLFEARSAKSANRAALREFGEAHGPYRVRKATEEDISWVKMMGGVVLRP